MCVPDHSDGFFQFWEELEQAFLWEHVVANQPRHSGSSEAHVLARETLLRRLVFLLFDGDEEKHF